jgi:hypothetical protein
VKTTVSRRQTLFSEPREKLEITIAEARGGFEVWVGEFLFRKYPKSLYGLKNAETDQKVLHKMINYFSVSYNFKAVKNKKIKK